MKKAIKFHSIYGYSTASARNGEKVSIAFRINCKNDLFPDGKLRMISNILDDIAYPEVIRRVKEAQLPIDFGLNKVHIVMFGDESRNEILLNEEVRLKG